MTMTNVQHAAYIYILWRQTDRRRTRQIKMIKNKIANSKYTAQRRTFFEEHPKRIPKTTITKPTNQNRNPNPNRNRNPNPNPNQALKVAGLERVLPFLRGVRAGSHGREGFPSPHCRGLQVGVASCAFFVPRKYHLVNREDNLEYDYWNNKANLEQITSQITR